jgi:hypothetical protein
MTATNSTPLEALDSALTEVKRALTMLQECQARQPDADIYRCTMHHVVMALQAAQVDLIAAKEQKEKA